MKGRGGVHIGETLSWKLDESKRNSLEYLVTCSQNYTKQISRTRSEDE